MGWGICASVSQVGSGRGRQMARERDYVALGQGGYEKRTVLRTPLGRVVELTPVALLCAFRKAAGCQGAGSSMTSYS